MFYKQSAWLMFSLIVSSSAFTQNPVPFVNTPLVPSAIAPGSPGLTLTVNGTGFTPGAVVKWNGAPLITSFVTGSELTASVPGADVALAGTASVTVTNPGTPDSNVALFSITNPTVSFFYAHAPGSPITLGFSGQFR